MTEDELKQLLQQAIKDKDYQLIEQLKYEIYGDGFCSSAEMNSNYY